MADDRRAPRDIHLLTTDALLAELIGGGSIAIDSNNLLSLGSDDARAVLDWYRRNRTKWAGNLSAVDTDAVIDVIGVPPPVAEAATSITAQPSAKKILRLAKVVAHRFAGLHGYGRRLEAPDTFVFEPSKGITLFEGVNGSGKTSIANAIIWCLTGHLIRSQRPPEEGPTEFACEIARTDGTLTTHAMSAVTPMPHLSDDLPADGGSILADSWVEVTFVDEDGRLLAPLRRSQSRNARGKIVEQAPDLDSVGLDPIAWRIATTMPGLLPFLSVGSASQLGEAVARLTGLADLVDLARHAEKMSDRIEKKAIGDLETQRSGSSERYGEAVKDLAGIVIELPVIAFEGEAPAVGDEQAAERIATIARHFADLKAEALREATNVLGEAFDPEDKDARDNLEMSIRPAIEQLAKHTGELPSIARLVALSVTKEDLAAVTSLLAQVEAEAETLAQLLNNPDRARRAQLYARVSGWMHEHNHVDDGQCPVCVGRLEGACDPITGNPVSAHLSEAARDREVIAKTITEWTGHWCARLVHDLPASIAKEARSDLPAGPAMLLQAGLGNELFATEPFRGALSALKPDTQAWVTEQLALLPAFEEPAIRHLPSSLATKAKSLQQMIDRTVRALAFAEWRESCGTSLRQLMQTFVKRGQADISSKRPTAGERLASLLRIVEGAAPLSRAIEQTVRMEATRKDYMAKGDRIAAGRRAVTVLDLLVPLGGLAQTQVETLRSKLHKRSEHWRRAVYRPATTFAPDLTGTGMNARGVLELKVGRDGVAAPAQHISNASALRGALMGFFLAFREHVLATRGGVSLLVLDDPQELLDHHNRQRLAHGLAQVGDAGAQLLVTTHERRFAQSLVAENRSADRIEHLSVHPVNQVRPVLGLSPAIEEVDRQRQRFLDNQDSRSDAQNYASDLRVFLEARLGDLFDDLAEPAYATTTKALTLFPLVDKLRALMGNGTGDLFSNPTLKKFVDDPALAEGATARNVLNTSHHDKASLTYVDVKDVEPAFVRLRTSIEKVHEQFRLHRWREPLVPDEAANVISLRPVAKPSFSVPICPDIAAFVENAPDGGSQDTATESVGGDWFTNKAYFYIRGASLGFAIPSGAVAIVETDPYPGRDQNMVIAQVRGQVLARRVAKSPGSLGVSLSAQMPDPRTARPTMTYEESKARLHRIVGAIFTDMPPPAGSGEATPVDAVPELAKIEAAYRVREESAVPLALPKQVILGGAELTPADLDLWEGKLAAITLTDGSSVFKRVGTRLPGKLRHLRQFEAIGGLGSSMVIATEAVDGDRGAPLMASARRVLGVLYRES